MTIWAGLILVIWMENKKKRVKSLGDGKNKGFPSCCFIEEKENKKKKMSNQIYFIIITSHKLE